VASRPFQVFAKPAGAACNLACRYCYYLEVPGGGRRSGATGEALRADPAPSLMPDEVLDAYIRQHLEAAPTPDVLFSWHGGEPTLLGTRFFERAVALQRRYRRDGQRVVNGLQTNGTLIDDEWCRFLESEGFLVGLSIDGPAGLHDCYRVSRGGTSSHAGAVRAFERLRAHAVPCEVLSVVHDRNVREPLRVYRFLRQLGARELTFLPLVEALPGGAGVSSRSVDPRAYGDFLCAIFDEWLAHDRGRIAVQIFDEATRPARGLPHSVCIFRETCGDVPVVEHDGAVYACDHFVDPAHLLGNVRETPLALLLDDPRQLAFGDAKKRLLPRWCRECPVLPMCNGGCPKDRFATSPSGEAGVNYLCAGLKRFFAHVLPFAVEAGLERLGLPAKARSAPVAARSVGRNAPCPCGSGKKFKNCCGAGATGSASRPLSSPHTGEGGA
jgi:uncharacterized protein